ncbi:MAG: SdpI family protein [Clostridia bacterium]|nr:SdpI family protein [Clostridia bacterium]
MLRENKLKVIISSLIILLPSILGLIIWDKLPNNMVIHWGADGNADGLGAKAFAVFGLPLILLAVHLLCLIVTAFDKKQREQNKKALGIIFWIIPFISLFVNSLIYFISFDRKFDMIRFMPIIFGVMFIFIGNYMPKVKQNHTLGIKISWTLNNEENWNKTHRLAGKIWVITGAIIILSVFLPLKLIISIFVLCLLISVLTPTVYSYSIYKNYQKQGIAYNNVPKTKGEKFAVRITAIIVPIILIGVAFLMFTGDINVEFKTDSFEIVASYYDDLEIKYDNIDSVEYRENFDAGYRSYGFSSARLSLGIFQNEEFDLYTRYSYTGVKKVVVLKSDEKVLVLSGKNETETKEIYEKILEKVK